VYHLTKAGVADNAINNKALYETIVAHRYRFSRVGNVDYNLHHPKTLNPIPIAEKIEDWKIDYTKMKEDMIYEENKPSFEEIIKKLTELKEKINALDWKLETKFPTTGNS
jgi:hypothetical protein